MNDDSGWHRTKSLNKIFDDVMTVPMQTIDKKKQKWTQKYDEQICG